MCRYTHVSWHKRGSQWTTCGSQVSPSSMWVPGLEFKSIWQQVPFHTEPSLKAFGWVMSLAFSLGKMNLSGAYSRH